MPVALVRGGLAWFDTSRATYDVGAIADPVRTRLTDAADDPRRSPEVWNDGIRLNVLRSHGSYPRRVLSRVHHSTGVADAILQQHHPVQCIELSSPSCDPTRLALLAPELRVEL